MAKEQNFVLKSRIAEAKQKRNYWEHVIASSTNPEADWARMAHALTEIKFAENSIRHSEMDLNRAV
jgi:anti-sigma regulatory factor (Ser/Thr protein kinase)